MPSQCLHGGHLLRFSKHKKKQEKCYPQIFQASCSEIALRNGQQPENIAGACHDLSNIQGSCHKLGTRSKMLIIFCENYKQSGDILFSRGPCGEHEVLGLQQDTLEPECVANSSKVILLVIVNQMSCHKNLF